MKILNKIFGMRTMGILIMIFGVAIGRATFIENDFGTDSAKALVYNHWWFELLLTFLVANMVVVIFTHRLYRPEKYASLMFHVAFIVILIGAGITRFIGYEGIMPIREGETTNRFVSTESFVSVWINGVEKDDKKVLFSEKGGADYDRTFSENGSDFRVELIEYIPRAIYEVVDDLERGSPILTLVTAGPDGRQNNYLSADTPINLSGLPVTFNDSTANGSIQIMESDSGLVFRSPMPVNFMRMADQSNGNVEPNTWAAFNMRQLYVIAGINFVFSEFKPSAILTLKSSPDKNSRVADVVRFNVSKGEDTQLISLTGGKGIRQEAKTVEFDGTTLSVAYGSLTLQLPFSIKLNDFQLERYPGSESPSSYASEVTLIDEADGVTKPFRVYMNNILEYKGFRFYQSSYDPDEEGTYLSVNHDYWGTFVTYWGYFFLFLGLILVVFSKNTRFHQLSKMIDQIHKKRTAGLGILLLVLLSFQSFGQESHETVPSKEHAAKFGSILVQTQDGRITPINTSSSEVLRKISKSDSYNGYTADQVFLGMMSHPESWREEKMIRVNHKELYPVLGIDSKYASFLDFFTTEGDYKLKTAVDVAFKKKPAERNTFDKEVISVDERVNVAYMTYFGSFLRMFPVPGHPQNKWVTPVEPTGGLAREDSLFITGFIPLYLEYLEKGMSTGDYTEVDQLINGIKNYQTKYGAEVLPSTTKVNLELIYNKANLFKRLFPYYMLLGFAFLILLYVRLLRPKAKLKYGLLVLQWLIMVAFVLHGIGLGLRWYISGHEPWSNGYESMLYIAWAGLLAGLIFRLKSPITLAVTSILAGIILFVAHLSWMDPEITNLVPVLKSYWLTIHVATITASYGFLALGALLAFVNLVSMFLRTNNNRARLNLTLKEVTYVIEMTLTVGLILLTIGNFLGGIWANESWGRYWGWDPKETWAMATIVFYAFVLHMRFIPGLRGVYAFNLAALITFSSVIMTYFGVNFYLSGLHSYAKGDPLPIPNFVYYTIGVIAIVAILAFINDRIDKKKVNEQEA